MSSDEGIQERDDQIRECHLCGRLTQDRDAYGPVCCCCSGVCAGRIGYCDRQFWEKR